MMIVQEKTDAEVPHSSKLPSPPATKKSTIAFFGIFGIQNLGNECTLQAIVHNARERLPVGEIYCISYDPDDTLRRHNLRAVSITSRSIGGQRRGGLARILRIIFRRIPGVLLDWLKAIRTLRGTDLMVMTGTGMLTDYSTTAFGFAYDVFRWSVAARLAGCKVRFVGVGVGPIYEWLSRRFIRCALSVADYRSFRDQFSKQRIAKLCFDSSKDHVFPDLAFSLPKELFVQRSSRNRRARQVGLGVMDHRDRHLSNPAQHQAEYSAYLEKMCEFVVWLIDHGYSVRILQGDARHDGSTRADLKARLERRGIRYDQAGIIDEDTATVEEVIAQISKVDIVVSPRFHNLILGLMHNIPVVSISYDPKNDALLDGFGLTKYHQPLTELDVQKLIAQFVELESRADELAPSLSKKASEYRSQLEEQYELIFGDV